MLRKERKLNHVKCSIKTVKRKKRWNKNMKKELWQQMKSYQLRYIWELYLINNHLKHQWSKYTN